MKRVSKVIVASLMVTGLFITPAFAVDTSQTLDQILNGGNTTTVQAEGNQSNIQTATNGSLLNGLSGVSDMSEPDQAAEKAARPMVTIIQIVVQILSYLLVAGLALRVALDLIYIGVPPFRGLLIKNDGMQRQAGNGMPGGMGMGMRGMGMGMGGMGMGGMSGMGMGGMSGMNGMQGGMTQGGNVGTGGVQWVSNSAISAVLAESTPGPDGSKRSAFGIYIKDMTLILVLTPLLLVLAVTGVLTNLGLSVGVLISNAISGFAGMM